MLHDLFLYDWRIKSEQHTSLHAFKHPFIALENSKKIFNLNMKEEDIIIKHMWPVTLKLPKYFESYVVTLVDKFCALKESLQYANSIIKSKKLYRYSYVFLSLLIFKI
jgi:uncharacterized protein